MSRNNGKTVPAFDQLESRLFLAATPLLKYGDTVPGHYSTGQAQYYGVAVRAGDHLVVACDVDAPTADASLFVKFGARPTTSSFDVKSDWNHWVDTALDVVAPRTGFYYIMVRANAVAPGGVNYAVSVDSLAHMPALPIGPGPIAGTMPRVQDMRFYKLVLAPSQSVDIQLDGLIDRHDGAPVNDANALYVRKDHVPGPTQYDQAAFGNPVAHTDSPDQFLTVVAPPTGGTYFVLVRNKYDADKDPANVPPVLPDAGNYHLAVNNTPPVGAAIVLTAGTQFAGNLIGNYQTALFRVDMVAGDHLFVQLEGQDVADINYVYVRAGSVPTPVTFDIAGTTPSSDQFVEINPTATASYYILVRTITDSILADGGAFTLRVDNDATFGTLVGP